jgi:hypothetical protein
MKEIRKVNRNSASLRAAGKEEGEREENLGGERGGMEGGGMEEVVEEARTRPR